MIVAACWLGGAGNAAAQQPAGDARLGRVAIDVHGVTGGLGPTQQQADALGYAKTDLPNRGFGWDVGGQVYLFRMGKVTLGAGGNLVRLGGSSDPVDTNGVSTGNRAKTRFQSMGLQVSANFGTHRGWSYVSAGYGMSTFAIWNPAAAEPTGLPTRSTINFGFGARWFQKDHLAVSFDMRFYKVSAQGATAVVPDDAAQTRFVIGAGVSFR